MATKKRAIIKAVGVVVLCPHCEAKQPAPDNGSDIWTVDILLANEGERACVSCDEPIVVMRTGKPQWGEP